MGHLKRHNFFKDCKYVRNCMTPLVERVRSDSTSNSYNVFLDFLYRILVWEPEKRMRPEEALQHPWIVQGLPA